MQKILTRILHAHVFICLIIAPYQPYKSVAVSIYFQCGLIPASE